MKTRKLLNEIMKSGLIFLISGYIIITQWNNLIGYLVGFPILIYGLILGHRYTRPKSVSTSEKEKEEEWEEKDRDR